MNHDSKRLPIVGNMFHGSMFAMFNYVLALCVCVVWLVRMGLFPFVLIIVAVKAGWAIADYFDEDSENIRWRLIASAATILILTFLTGVVRLLGTYVSMLYNGNLISTGLLSQWLVYL